MRKALPIDDPAKIRIDIAHTWAISGLGKDALASGLVFMACHCNAWGEGKIEVQLDNAYSSFKQWCIDNRKTTSIIEFTYKELKIKSLLGSYIFNGFYWFLITPYLLDLARPVPQPPKLLRLKEFPRGLGKGFDAALIGGWLGDFLDSFPDHTIPVSQCKLKSTFFNLFVVNKWYMIVFLS